MGVGSGEWGVSNEDEVTGVSISSVSKVFNSKVSCSFLTLGLILCSKVVSRTSSRSETNVSSPQRMVLNLKNQLQKVKRSNKALLLALS